MKRNECLQSMMWVLQNYAETVIANFHNTGGALEYRSGKAINIYLFWGVLATPEERFLYSVLLNKDLELCTVHYLKTLSYPNPNTASANSKKCNSHQ